MTGIAGESHELEDWMDRCAGRGWIWSVKYIAANDTYAKRNVHQGGPYVPKELLSAAFPQLTARASVDENPDVVLPASVDSHGTTHELRLVWYNSRRRMRQANGRDEARLTRWGSTDSPVVAAESTGALAVFAFFTNGSLDAEYLRVWICRDVSEEEQVLARVGDVEPGRGLLVDPHREAEPEIESPCALSPSDMPEAWRTAFPKSEDVVQWVLV